MLSLHTARCSGSLCGPKSMLHSMAAVLLALGVVGCGGGSSRSEGTIAGTVTSAGQPVTAGRVVFSSQAAGASGMANLEADGSFRVEGTLPVGDYKVYLTPPGLGDAPPAEPGQETSPPELTGVPQKYQNEATTDLTVTVEAGTNRFELDLAP